MCSSYNTGCGVTHPRPQPSALHTAHAGRAREPTAPCMASAFPAPSSLADKAGGCPLHPSAPSPRLPAPQLSALEHGSWDGHGAAQACRCGWGWPIGVPTISSPRCAEQEIRGMAGRLGRGAQLGWPGERGSGARARPTGQTPPPPSGAQGLGERLRLEAGGRAGVSKVDGGPRLRPHLLVGKRCLSNADETMLQAEGGRMGDTQMERLREGLLKRPDPSCSWRMGRMGHRGLGQASTQAM